MAFLLFLLLRKLPHTKYRLHRRFSWRKPKQLNNTFQNVDLNVEISHKYSMPNRVAKKVYADITDRYNELYYLQVHIFVLTYPARLW